MLSERERRTKILDFVRENSIDPDQKQILKITKSDVMRHLKEVRPMTTHKTIVELIKEGKINMVKDKPYSQTDYLVLNDNNDFNKIFKAWKAIDKLIDIMDQPLENITNLSSGHPMGRDEHRKSCPDCKIYSYLGRYFENVYESLVQETLDALLYMTAQRITIYYDHLSMYYNIINSKVKLHNQVNRYGQPFIAIDLNLENDKIEYAEKKGIPIRSLILEMKAIVDPFNQTDPPDDILMLRPEDIGPPLEESKSRKL